tara:strand:+ start:1383 stop:1547 length:165 start_codon:yes stop_codon:yes gene_type:complete
MGLTDVKLYIANGGAFMASCCDFIEPTLKILLLAATLGYTLNRWYVLRKKNKDE